MAEWKHTIDLSEEFSRYGDGGEFEPFKASATKKLREFAEARLKGNEDLLGVFTDLVACLEEAEDADEWDNVWEEFYGLCDENSIWVRALT